MSSRIWAAGASIFLVLSVLLGGASAAGALANAMLQSLSVLVIVALAWAGRLRVPSEARLLAWTVGCFLVLAAFTLIPLPLALWQQLPYRGQIAEALGQLGISSGSLAVSLAPEATLWSLLGLLPPVAMFLLVTALPADRRGMLFGTVTAIAIASISLGIFQLLSGPQSMRPYEITNEGFPVGFFANVNHNATLVLCALPCLASLGARFAGRRDRSRRSGGFIIIAGSVAFMVLGVGIMGSMAGYGLLIPALFASALIYRRAIFPRISAAWRAVFTIVAVLFVVGALAGPLSQERLSAKFSDNPTSRKVIAETTVEAVSEAFPVGTGLGTFSDVYRRFQDPAAASTEYVNHAHNDYLEIALELGLPGILLVLLFFAWWLGRSLHVWRHDVENASSARAGSIIVGIVLLHSLVDYPIRTSAIAALFALGCALLVSGRPHPHGRGERRGRATHISITDDVAHDVASPARPGAGGARLDADGVRPQDGET